MAKKLKPHPLDKHHVTHYAIFVCMIVAMVVFVMSFGSGPLVGKAFDVVGDVFPLSMSFTVDDATGLLTSTGAFDSPQGYQHITIGEVVNGKVTVTTVNPICGDGIWLEVIEQCDWGTDETQAQYNGMECTIPAGEDSCTYCDDGCHLVEYTLDPICSDGIVQADLGEECDDGNLDNGDGCDENCMIEQLGLVACPLGGMQSYWKAEGMVEDSIAGKTGLMFNGADFTNGLVGQTFSYIKDQDQYTELAPTNEMLIAGAPFTVMLWFKTDLEHPAYGGEEGRLITFKRDLPDLISSSLSLYVQDNTVSFLYYPADGSPHPKVNYVFDYADNLWHLLTLTYDNTAGEFKYYLDDNLLGDPHSGIYSFDLGAGHVLLGSFDGASRFFQGQIDEVAVFDKKLTQSEIIELYNNAELGFCEPEVVEGVCGDGFQDPNEACDLGEGFNDVDCNPGYNEECVECLANCQNYGAFSGGYCGDDAIQVEEECDDANDIDDDECKNDCTLTAEPTIDFEPVIQSVTPDLNAKTFTVNFDIITVGGPFDTLPVVEANLQAEEVEIDTLGVPYVDGGINYNAVFELEEDDFNTLWSQGFTADVFVDVNNDHKNEISETNNQDFYEVEPATSCGDGVCDLEGGETFLTCPGDGCLCGDGIVQDPEELCDGGFACTSKCICENEYQQTDPLTEDCELINTNILFEPPANSGDWLDDDPTPLWDCSVANVIESEEGNYYINNPFIRGYVKNGIANLDWDKTEDVSLTEFYCDPDTKVVNSRRYVCPDGSYQVILDGYGTEACHCTDVPEVLGVHPQCGPGWFCDFVLGPDQGRCKYKYS